MGKETYFLWGEFHMSKNIFVKFQNAISEYVFPNLKENVTWTS